MRKKRKAEAREFQKQAERRALEEKVLADPWTQDEQIAFENALLSYTPMLEKHERWSLIAAQVPGKSCNQCIFRYKFLKEYVALQKAE